MNTEYNQNRLLCCHLPCSFKSSTGTVFVLPNLWVTTCGKVHACKTLLTKPQKCFAATDISSRLLWGYVTVTRSLLDLGYQRAANLQHISQTTTFVSDIFQIRSYVIAMACLIVIRILKLCLVQFIRKFFLTSVCLRFCVNYLNQFHMIDNFSRLTEVTSQPLLCSIFEKTNFKRLGFRKRAYLPNCGR